MLAINPKMLPRLDEIEADLLARRARARTPACRQLLRSHRPEEFSDVGDQKLGGL
jgi:hypothetical protein